MLMWRKKLKRVYILYVATKEETDTEFVSLI